MAKDNKPPQKVRVFISHAVKDQPVIDAFFDLLQTGCGLAVHETFCSSLEGMGIPGGKNFITHIKEQIQKPELILLMISPNYLESLFCHCELGAGWAMSHELIPILLPNTDYSVMKAVLTGIQALKIDSKTDLAELRDQMRSQLQLPEVRSARWDAKRDEFLQELPDLVKKLGKPQYVDLKTHQEVLTNYEGAILEIRDLSTTIEELKDQITQLEACKNREEVAKVKRKNSKALDVFHELCEKAESRADKLPAAVREAIYQRHSDHPVHPGRDHIAEVKSAAQRKYLFLEEDGAVSVNDDQPLVKAYLQAVREVDQFLNSDQADPAFYDLFEEEYEYSADISNRDLWEERLGLSQHSDWS